MIILGLEQQKRSTMDVYKNPKEYAKEVKQMGFTKEEFLEHLISMQPKLPKRFILDCLHAW